MATPYSQTFTLVAGGITITFNVRPGSIRYNDQVMIARGPIPGSNQSFVQHMGNGGLEVEFEFSLWNITSITMTGGPTNAEDILMRLRTWFRAGTTLAVTTDHILELNANAAMDMKMIEFSRIENSGVAHDYQVRILLQQFNPGLAI